MYTSELRLNNYVLCRGALCQVTAIRENTIGYKKSSGVGEDAIPIKFVQPIPLKQESLLKLGFEEKEIDKRTFCRVLVKKGFRVTISNSGNVYYGKLCLNSFHEIQNLYFAVKGEELFISKSE